MKTKYMIEQPREEQQFNDFLYWSLFVGAIIVIGLVIGISVSLWYYLAMFAK